MRKLDQTKTRTAPSLKAYERHRMEAECREIHMRRQSLTMAARATSEAEQLLRYGQPAAALYEAAKADVARRARSGQHQELVDRIVARVDAELAGRRVSLRIGKGHAR